MTQKMTTRAQHSAMKEKPDEKVVFNQVGVEPPSEIFLMPAAPLFKTTKDRKFCDVTSTNSLKSKAGV